MIVLKKIILLVTQLEYSVALAFEKIQKLLGNIINRLCLLKK
jgi:hypothetical protein